MKQKLAAAQEPGQQGQAHAGERRGRQRRQHGGVLHQPAFQQHAKPTGQQLQMTARHRHDAGLADVEGDGRKVSGRIARPFAIEQRYRVELFGREQIVERHHAVGQVGAKAADIADRKHVGRNPHGELAVIDAPDMAASDERLGADARERCDRFGPAPQQRQGRGDHAGPHHAENGENVLDDVGQLDADDGVGRQLHLAQAPGDRRDHAVGLGKSEAPRRAVGESFAVRRVGQRQRLGPALRDAAENLVDGDAARALLRLRVRGLTKDHCSADPCLAGRRHQVSGR